MLKRLLRSFIVASSLAPHTCFQSTVTQKENKRLLTVFMFIGSRVKPPTSPQTRISGGGGRSLPRVLVPKNTFTNVFNNTCDISDFIAHIFCPRTTQELPKKHNEAGTPEQLPTDALAQINNVMDTLDTVKITCANEWRNGHFGKFE